MRLVLSAINEKREVKKESRKREEAGWERKGSQRTRDRGRLRREGEGQATQTHRLPVRATLGGWDHQLPRSAADQQEERVG